MYMTVFLGCLVGVVVVAQTLYTSTMEHIKEFGTVKAIDFLPVDADTTRNLRIELGIDRHAQDQVRDNSKARLHTMGLLGDKLIDISPGTPGQLPAD